MLNMKYYAYKSVFNMRQRYDEGKEMVCILQQVKRQEVLAFIRVCPTIHYQFYYLNLMVIQFLRQNRSLQMLATMYILQI